LIQIVVLGNQSDKLEMMLNLIRSDSSQSGLRILIALALLFILVLAIYANTFQAAWQFDDKPNIINNDFLHLRDLNPASLIQTLYTNPTDSSNPGTKLYRPVSFLTFALNWYVGRDTVTGYHVVNILIHFLTAGFLFLAALYLLGGPKLGPKYDHSKYVIAFGSAALWAANPIHTQAVTYIVQRMASLAALFYILGIFCYVKCRLSNFSLYRVLFMLGCALSFLLALGSKENAVMLPASLILIEIICFQDFDRRLAKAAYFWGSIAAVVTVLLIGIWLFLPQLFFSVLNGFQNRPFTLAERLLTEPRIVIFYLSQIYYPVPARLSIEHDVVISTSLFQPWTTLPAILLVLLLIGLGISQIRRRPLIALAILFFFLNHIIESTFIPLELIFEHRNYLPSLFLFLPIAAGLKRIYDYYRPTKRALSTALAAFAAMLIIGLGAGTYVRNLAWATEFSLWRDAMVKAPHSARPLTNLAWLMAYGPDAHESLYDDALQLYEKARFLQKPRKSAEAVIMNNMAGIYFKKGLHQEAIDLLTRALAIAPDYTRGRYDLAKILIASGRWHAASEHIDYLLAQNETHEGYLNLKGMTALHSKHYDEAKKYFHKSLITAPFFKDALMNLGIAHSLEGHYSKAEIYLIRAYKVHPRNMLPLLAMIENSLKATDFESAQKYTDILLRTYSIAAIKDQLNRLSQVHRSVFLSAESISPVIENRWTNTHKTALN
jgi:tetratricopeptide (TPR) repeat protein